jgi:AcrR family transcriptional regulator
MNETSLRRTQASRSHETRTALIRAGRRLFAEHGYAGANREDIAEFAGVTRGALYHHFDSKEDLFVAVYEAVEEELLGVVKLAARTFTDPIEMIRAGCIAFIEAASQRESARIALVDAPAVLSRSRLNELRERYWLGLIRQELMEVETSTPLNGGDAETWARMLLSTAHEAALGIANGGSSEAYLGIIELIITSISSSNIDQNVSKPC